MKKFFKLVFLVTLLPQVANASSWCECEGSATVAASAEFPDFLKRYRDGQITSEDRLLKLSAGDLKCKGHSCCPVATEPLVVRLPTEEKNSRWARFRGSRIEFEQLRLGTQIEFQFSCWDEMTNAGARIFTVTRFISPVQAGN